LSTVSSLRETKSFRFFSGEYEHSKGRVFKYNWSLGLYNCGFTGKSSNQKLRAGSWFANILSADLKSCIDKSDWLDGYFQVLDIHLPKPPYVAGMELTAAAFFIGLTCKPHMNDWNWI
jgi:hypothetical protein